MKEEKKSAKLLRFEEAIRSMSNKEAEAIIEKTNAEAEMLVTNTERQLKKKYTEEIAAYKQTVINTCEKDISKAGFDCGRAVLLRRSELIGELFDGIVLKLNEFAVGEKYQGYLERCFCIASEALPFYDGVTARCRERDVKAVDALAKRAGICVAASTEVGIGGVVFIYPRENRIIDISLGRSLENEKEAFVANTEMQL